MNALLLTRRYALSIGFGVLACALIVSAVGIGLDTFFVTLWNGSFSSLPNFLNAVRWATPEIIVGIAFAVAFRAGLFNLGMDGQIYVGALAGAAVVTAVPAPPVIAPLLGIVAGMVAAGAWAALAAWLLNRFGVTEVVSTLMFNYIAILLTTFIVKTFFMNREGAQASYTIATGRVPTDSWIPLLHPSSQANLAIVIAVLLAFGTWWMLSRSTAGYAIRSLGASEQFARYDGFSPRRVRLGALSLSGAIAGLAGVTEILGVQHSFVEGFSNGLGFDGIIVSIIGAHHPIGIVFSGFFFGALKNTGLQLSLSGDVSSYVVTLLTAVFIFAFSIRIIRRRKQVR